jgi:hypothetical protein
MFDQYLQKTRKKILIYLENKLYLFTATDFAILNSPLGVHTDIVPSF